MNAKTVSNLTSKLERRLSITFAVKYFYSLLIDTDAWYSRPFSGSIVMPKLRGTKLREFLYHELGHALLAEYQIPKSSMAAFTRRNPGLIEYWFSGSTFASKEPKAGFISGYAQISNEEDFCECFSAWVINGFKTNGIIKFQGACFNLNRDAVLKRKMEAVSEIVSQCQEAEKVFLKKTG